MKKILSFLAKKPLALAAVALFSMSSFAQGTDAPEAGGGTTDKKPTTAIWQKVGENNPLYYFDKVTVVDESRNKVYADNGVQQIAAIPFRTLDEDGNIVPGTTIAANASFFYVAQGAESTLFSLNKSLKQDEDGNYLKLVDEEEYEVVDYEEGVTPTEGAVGGSEYLKENGVLGVSDLWPEVCWFWDYLQANNELLSGSNLERILAYNTTSKIFEVTISKSAKKAVLYKAVEKVLPYFDPEEGIITNPGEDWAVTIVNENPDGTVMYRMTTDDPDDEDGWTDWTEYTGPIPYNELDKEVTFETYIEFDGGSTEPVEATYLLTNIAAPVIDPVSGEYKVENDGTAPVTITDATEGAAISYYTKDADATVAEPTWSEYDDENKPDVADYANSEKDVTVTAKASKEVTFKGKKETVYSEETSETYTVKPNATPNDLDFVLKAKPLPGSEVGGGDIVALWWEIGNTDYDYYTLDPNSKITELTLTFHTADGDVEETVNAVVKDAKDFDKDAKVEKVVTFKVPGKPEYYNTEFEVAVPAAFYLATAGKNVVETEEATVNYKMGLGSSDFVIDPETTIQPTDDNTILVRVYPRNNENAEVDFANPVQGESNYGAKFTGAESEVVTEITKVEKITTDEEGNELPNTFEITFENGDGKADFIKKYLRLYAHLTPQEQAQLGFSGYSVGFLPGTFKTDQYVNGEELNHHVKFVESVTIKIVPSHKVICEGDRMMIYTLQLTGNVSGDSYNTPYDSDKESQVVFDDEAEVTIKGTNIFDEEENIKATITVAEPRFQKSRGIKETYAINWNRYDKLDPENPLDFGWNLRTDNGTDYEVTIPAGTFKVNLSENDEYKGTADVMAHPNWAATARPYSYDEGKQETSTLVLDLTATLDNPIKVFERNLKVDNEEAVFTVVGADGTEVEVESWEFDGPSEAYTTTFESKPSYKFDGRDGKWLNGTEDVQEESGVITLHLATPIADVQEYTITIPEGTFRANTCLNKTFSVTVEPYVTYFIQEIKYIIPTSQKSITYDIWGQLPDGSRLEVPIAYIGETDPELRNLYNALRYNNAHYVDVDETGEPGAEKITDGEWFYPEVSRTKYNPDAKTTTFTISFPNGLVQNYYKMNFPAGTVQAEGYVPNDNRLYNPFDVVPAFVFDATSSFEDYNQPSVYPKKKEYNISTKTTEITLYLTAENPDDEYTNNANSDILLLEGTDLGFAKGEIADEAQAEAGKFKWVNVQDGIFTVTIVDEDGKPTGLQPGTYTLVVPSHSVTTKSTYKIPGTGTALNTDNPEAFFLTINVEDFTAPEEAIKITTKTYYFDVKVSDDTETLMTVIKDEEGNAPVVQLGGAEATLENSDKPGYVRVVLPTAEKEECKPCFDMPKDAPDLVKGAIEDELEEEVTEPKLGYLFMHSCQEPEEEPAPYPLVIPAGSFKGAYATNYDKIEVDVDVIFEFIDSGTGITDDLDEPNDLTTTFCEVLDEVFVQKEMLFTRAFRNQNMQALAVPFDIKQSEVAEYFTIYRLNMVWENTEGIQLNYVSIGEDGIAYANKPYIIVPTAKAVEETKASETGAVSITFEDKEVVFPMMSFINCATTKVHYQFFNTLFKQKFDADMVDEFGWKTLSGGEIANISASGLLAWRWWIAPSDKFGNYVKIALDGFVQDDADGIDFVQAAEGDNTIYNVAGQKLNAPAKGKVNIINGKKVFVK